MCRLWTLHRCLPGRCGQSRHLGMFASFDPVALDQACADAVNRQPVIEGSVLSEKEHCHHDHFTDTHPDTNWESCLEHAVKMGMGSREYELIEIK